MIFSYSPINILGSKDNYVRIFSSDKSGQGITLINTKQYSKFDYVSFEEKVNVIVNTCYTEIIGTCIVVTSNDKNETKFAAEITKKK